MLSLFIGRLVDFSQRFAPALVLLAFLMSLGLGWYVMGHFKINTDINQLISADLDWRIREAAVEKGFPQKSDLLVVVVDGDTPDAAEAAAEALTLKLRTMPERFSQVIRPDKIPFFQKNGLLFLSKDELDTTLNQMIEAEPVLGILAGDPSLRGFFGMISFMLQGVQRGETDFKQLDAPFNTIADTIEADLAGQAKPLSWQTMSSSQKSLPRDLRKFILTKPILDFTALQPGAAASNAIRTVVSELHLTPDHGVRVRLTGAIALNDEEFASVAEGTGGAAILSIVLVLIILWLALRSFRIVIPILLTLIVGLIMTTAFALLAVGSLNLISVAFAVMFIGIAVDFGIQFAVRYRDQHHREPEHAKAMKRTGQLIALPLTMAAASTSLGFFAFIPTAYRGVSELGLIAGTGMIIAYLLNITLLPALLAFFRPPAEPEPVGFKWAAPVDVFIQTNRRKILLVSLLIAVIGIGIATRVRFDFDPLNLKDPQTESVSTLLDAMKDPDFNIYTIDILRHSLKEAQVLAGTLQKLPQVDHVLTLGNFVPDDQEEKLALISDASVIFASTLTENMTQTPLKDAEILASLHKLVEELRAVPNQPPSVSRLAKAIEAVIERHDHLLLPRLQDDLVTVMQAKLEAIKLSLSAEEVSTATITEDLRRDWVTPDGQALIEVYPKGNPRNHETLVAFTHAVREVAPDATGTPISIQESAHTVTQAFIYAGIYALLTIALLSFAVLRSARDVVILMAPLILAGILTMATIVLIGLPLNFANIIAIPLLLSLGVSYAIYFVSYARAGQKNPMQSSMARAVLFSAATALVAFGSLAISSHPGTSSMGKLLTIALSYSLACSFFLLNALLE
ncbi:MAG: MMPL family transporter [Methylobacter sp.]|nr:MMPL family transporter [Methylobacter sp.]